MASTVCGHVGLDPLTFTNSLSGKLHVYFRKWELLGIPCVMGGSFLHDVTHELSTIPCVMGGSFLHDVTQEFPLCNGRVLSP